LHFLVDGQRQIFSWPLSGGTGILGQSREGKTMADIYVYFESPLVRYSRWDIEDELEEWLGERGEVTGGGSFLDGSRSNIDLEVDTNNPLAVEALVEELRGVLRDLVVPADTHIAVFFEDESRKDYTVYSAGEGPPVNVPTR
jgi:hypothetical protein